MTCCNCGTDKNVEVVKVPTMEDYYITFIEFVFCQECKVEQSNE
jgi:hypothetical protein